MFIRSCKNERSFIKLIGWNIVSVLSFSKLTNGITDGLLLNHVAKWNGVEWENIGFGINGNYVESFEVNKRGEIFIGGPIFGSQNVWANGLIIYTNDYINLFFKDKLLYTLTNFNKTITISVNKCVSYIYNKQQI